MASSNNATHKEVVVVIVVEEEEGGGGGRRRHNIGSIAVPMMGWLGVCSAANEENQSHKLVNCVSALGLPTYILPSFNSTKLK